MNPVNIPLTCHLQHHGQEHGVICRDNLLPHARNQTPGATPANVPATFHLPFFLNFGASFLGLNVSRVSNGGSSRLWAFPRCVGKALEMIYFQVHVTLMVKCRQIGVHPRGWSFSQLPSMSLSFLTLHIALTKSRCAGLAHSFKPSPRPPLGSLVRYLMFFQ